MQFSLIPHRLKLSSVNHECFAQGHFSTVDGSQNRCFDQNGSLGKHRLPPAPVYSVEADRRCVGSLVTGPRNYILVLTASFIWSDLNQPGALPGQSKPGPESTVWDA